jgi:hypothetical protein
MGRQGRTLKQLLVGLKETERILEIERGSPVENSLWKACRKTVYGINKCNYVSVMSAVFSVLQSVFIDAVDC